MKQASADEICIEIKLCEQAEELHSHTTHAPFNICRQYSGT